MNPATITALQGCLALEHEAVWVYSYLGGRVTDVRDRAVESFQDHRFSRDRLLARLDAAGVTQPGPLASYQVDEVRTAKQAAAVARTIEAKFEAAWLAIVGITEGDERADAIAMLRTASLAVLDWQGRPAAFPGLP